MLKIAKLFLFSFLIASPLFALGPPFFSINDYMLDENFTLTDFYMYEYSANYNVLYARITNNTDSYFENVWLYYYFFKEKQLVKLDYTYLDYDTYGENGMLPHSESLLQDFVNTVEFDSVAFRIDYSYSDSGKAAFNEEALEITNILFESYYGSYYKISGMVTNISQSSVVHPTVFSCFFQDSNMIFYDLALLDINNDTLQPNAFASFVDYVNPPAEYDSIRYLPHYSLQLTGNVTIPVELAAFTAKRLESGVQLIWTTASETNNLGFYIERSPAGRNDWQRIGFVEGRGTTAKEHTYTFTDQSIGKPGVYLYRLVQTDFDAAETVSKVVSVAVHSPARTLGNYPNPFNSSTFIEFTLPEPDNVSLAVYDITGRKVKDILNAHLSAGPHSEKWDGTDNDGNAVSSGVYFLRLSAGGNVQVMKAVLQR